MSNIDEVNKEQIADLNVHSDGSDKVQAPTENVINRIGLIDVLKSNDYVNNNFKIFHKKLLKMAKEVDNKEIAFIWDIDKPLNESLIVLHKESTESEVASVIEQGINPIVVIGEDEKNVHIHKKILLTGKNKQHLIVMHNHPNNARLSRKDIMLILTNYNVWMLTAVCHSGKIHLLIKVNNENEYKDEIGDNYNLDDNQSELRCIDLVVNNKVPNLNVIENIGS